MTDKSALITVPAGLTLAVCLSCALLLVPAQVSARPQVVPVEGASFNVSASMVDNLQTFVGKKVTVTLDSGKTLVGIVKAVGDHLLHLEKLQGKEYFDALVRTHDSGR